jgi:hypothetical protein
VILKGNLGTTNLTREPTRHNLLASGAMRGDQREW